ncbi:MAG: flavodoxin domain-containing protein [Anaerolineae bacterium]|nr:flavodoxin domain-containing protein [Anaerolineae bacterium]
MSKNKITRRQFLIRGAGVVGATALACAGAGFFAARQPAVEFIESNCGQAENGGDGILIAYASEAGSTGEIAEAIGQVLCEAGTAVEVRPVQDISDLSSYRAVVVGSPIHASAWLPEAIAFVETHRNALSQMPVAYFLSCLTLAAPDADNLRPKVASFLDPVRRQVSEVQPVDVGLFAGKLDFSKLSFAYRVVWPFTAGGQVTEGDYRDWKTIKAWAGNLAPVLLNA